MKRTYTLTDDIPDVRNGKHDLETEQEEFLIEHLGLTLYGALCEWEKEHERTKFSSTGRG